MMGWYAFVINMATKLIVALVTMTPLTSATPDPCTDHKYIYDKGGRSPKCPYQPVECDRYITENWYKVVNYYGALKMPTSHVDINSCGANYPGWLNGTHPSVRDGVVHRSVCVSGYDDSCMKRVIIQVKNCGHFYVYYLVKMDGCSERYCFGIDGICPRTEAEREQGETTCLHNEQGETTWLDKELGGTPMPDTKKRKANVDVDDDGPIPSSANFEKGDTWTVAVLMSCLRVLISSL
ncbi:oncoprotein-induced transcript 3 protein-like [Haliotis cracherodii]|uniref:oncoprotein-induced transcript 3 protein-like n=1 Tax=Haliotis cracherodii TaxID=6455 RepID=UPI0039ED595C